MRKKSCFLVVAIVAFVTMFTSCSVTTPITATSNPVGNKCGEASSVRILLFGGSANSGINKAAKNGGITKISHVDYTHTTFLGLFEKYTTKVYGE